MIPEMDARFFIARITRGFLYAILTVIVPLLLLWNYYIFLGAVENLNGGGGNDFSRFYHATQSFFEGQGLYAPSKATRAQWFGMFGLHLWDLNTPHFHLLVYPLTFLSIKNAFLLWSLGSFMGLLVSVYLVSREVPMNITLFPGLFIFTGLLAFTGTGLLLRSGQITFLILLPFTLAWINARHSNWSKVGLYLGLCASIKPFFLIFLPYLFLRKCFSAIRSFTIIFVGAFLLGFLIFGMESHKDWLIALSSVNWFWAGSNASILGFLTRSLAESPTFSVAINAPTLIFPSWIIASMLVVLIAIVATVAGNTPKSVDRNFSILLISAFLISPLGWTYYYFFLFPPLVSLVLEWRKELKEIAVPESNWKFHGSILLLASSIPGFLVPMYYVSFYQPNPLATVSIGSIYFWSTLFVWFSLVWDWHLFKKKRASSILSWIKTTNATEGSPLTGNSL